LRAGPLVRATSAAFGAAGIVSLAAIGAGAAQLVAASGWTQYQGDAQHTGFAPSAPSPPFRVAWSQTTGIGDETHFAGIPAPVIDGGDAIVVDREDVTARSLDSGALAWTIPRDLGPSAPAAVAPGKGTTTIVYTEGGGDLSSSASGTPTPSATAGSAAAVLRSTLVAIDATTREVLWRRELPDVSVGGPTVDGSNVLVGTDDGSVTAVSLASGQQEWTIDLGDSVDTPIAASGGTAYVGVTASAGQPSFLAALRETDGAEIWRFNAGGTGVSFGAPAVANEVVYAAVGDATLRAIDAATGIARWAAKLNTVAGGGAPAVSADAVVVADVRGQVYRFAPETGERVWDFAMNTPVYGSVVIAGSRVVVGEATGDVSAIDLTSGERIWRQNVGEGLLLGFAVAPDTIVVARTGQAAGLVALVADPTASLISEQSPTIVEPVQLGLAWAVAAVPLVLLLILAGRFLDARLGPAPLVSGDGHDDGDRPGPDEDDT
jgi:outer membrane protein assembly factor BamB